MILMLLRFVRRLGVQAEAAIKCLNFVLTYAILTKGFVAFKTNVKIFSDILAPTLAAVVDVRHLVSRKVISELL